MPNNDHVTKADLNAGLHALRDELRSDLNAQREELLERISESLHDVETKLLKAFYGFPEGSQERMLYQNMSQQIFENRLGIIERRLLELEKRVNFPSAS